MAKSFVTFREVASPTTTKRWVVENTATLNALGEIAWYAPWRKYTFWPRTKTIWDPGCLREIADFVERMTKEHKAAGA